MGDEWFPSDTILTSDSIVKDFTENGAGVQFVHRAVAWVVVCFILFIWWKSNRLSLSKWQNKGISWLIYLTTLQVILGIFTILYSVPVVLGVFHQTVAFFLVASFLYVLFHLRVNKKVHTEHS
jgi:cytochrome c oxidase assembly protein subunit 15